MILIQTHWSCWKSLRARPESNVDLDNADGPEAHGAGSAASEAALEELGGL